MVQGTPAAPPPYPSPPVSSFWILCLSCMDVFLCEFVVINRYKMLPIQLSLQLQIICCLWRLELCISLDLVRHSIPELWLHWKSNVTQLIVLLRATWWPWPYLYRLWSGLLSITSICHYIYFWICSLIAGASQCIVFICYKPHSVVCQTVL